MKGSRSFYVIFHFWACFLFLCPCHHVFGTGSRVCSVQDDGTLFRHGGGWDGVKLLRSHVSDTGEVLFISPMPEYDESINAFLAGTYLHTDQGTFLVHSGVDLFSLAFGQTLRTTNIKSVADSIFQRYAVLSEERMSSISSQTTVMLHLHDGGGSLLDSIVLDSVGQFAADDCYMAMGDCRLLVGSGGWGARLYDVSSGKLVLEKYLTDALQHRTGNVLMSADGKEVFFSGHLEGHGLATGQSGIFAYAVDEGRMVLVAKGGRESLDAQLAVSGDGSTVVFKRLNDSFQIAVRENDIWNVAEHSLEDEGISFPAVSADGRFVVYSCSADDGKNICCYDVMSGTSEVIICGKSIDMIATISPNGRYISYVSMEASGVPHVYRVSHDVADSGKGWMLLKVTAGWNCLAMPFAVTSEGMMKLRSKGTLWVFDKGRFAQMNARLSSGQGFWYYAHMDSEIFLEGEDLPRHELVRGWNLIHPSMVSGECYAYDKINNVYIVKSVTDVENGYGVWRYVPDK